MKHKLKRSDLPVHQQSAQCICLAMRRAQVEGLGVLRSFYTRKGSQWVGRSDVHVQLHTAEESQRHVMGVLKGDEEFARLG